MWLPDCPLLVRNFDTGASGQQVLLACPIQNEDVSSHFEAQLSLTGSRQGYTLGTVLG